MYNENQKFRKVENFGINKKSNKKFIIVYVIFFILSLVITGVCIYLSIKNIDEQINKETEKNNIVVEEVKKISRDTKYVINSYDETYDANPIKITKCYDKDGNITKGNMPEYTGNYGYEIEYFEIEGLRDKEIQNRINERLKEKAYSLKVDGERKYVYSMVNANFSNILSVVMNNNDENSYKTEMLSVDLATGEDIKFEDLFIDSAPINLYIANAVYETLAWWEIETESFDADMDKVNTAEYEDKCLRAVRNYNKIKENIKFNIRSK